MQAIETKVLPATNTLPTRIKATCARGSIITSLSDVGSYSLAVEHAQAAKLLTSKFADEDKKKYGTPLNENPWSRRFVTGNLENGNYVHVFMD